MTITNESTWYNMAGYIYTQEDIKRLADELDMFKAQQKELVETLKNAVILIKHGGEWKPDLILPTFQKVLDKYTNK